MKHQKTHDETAIIVAKLIEKNNTKMLENNLTSLEIDIKLQMQLISLL